MKHSETHSECEMEEAYTALYQEFLRLQLLCLKQAEMLQHLTEALRRQQGTFTSRTLMVANINMDLLSFSTRSLRLIHRDHTSLIRTDRQRPHLLQLDCYTEAMPPSLRLIHRRHASLIRTGRH